MGNEIRNLSPESNENFFLRVIKYFVPWKGDGIAEIIRKFIFILSIVLFVASLNELTNFLKTDQVDLNYVQNIAKYEPNWDEEDDDPENGGDEYYEPDTINLSGVDADTDTRGSRPSGSGSGTRTVQNWAKDILGRNSEVVGWIKIPGFVNENGEEYINYPVMQRTYNGDIDACNDYYLRRDIDGNYYESGSIFVDCLVPVNEDGQPDNMIIYGHHMRRLGTSFTHLAEYKEGVDFLKKHPLIEFNTIYDKNQKYVIFACFVAASDETQDDIAVFDYWRYRNFDDGDYSFEKWIDNVRKESWYSADVECTEDDDYITLSTCSNEVANMRWVIVAKRMTADENLDLIVDSYKERPDSEIYFPKIWRDVWGNNKKYLGWSY